MTSLAEQVIAPLEAGIRELKEREQMARTERNVLAARLVQQPERAGELVKGMTVAELEADTCASGRAALLGRLEAVRKALAEAQADGRLERIEELRQTLADQDARDRIAAEARDLASGLTKLRPQAREADQALSARWQELASMLTALGLTPPPRPSTSAWVSTRMAFNEALRAGGITLSDFRS